MEKTDRRKVENTSTYDEKDENRPLDDDNLPQKSLFRIDEVAAYFSITERCVRLWIENGHLDSEKIVGIVRISRESILRCRLGVAAKKIF